MTLLTFLILSPISSADEKTGPPPARNIILMISDGAGFNAFDACSYYQYGRLGKQAYDRFPVRLACTTFMLKSNGTPLGYEPVSMWQNFDYAMSDSTDSAAAATALNSGEKTKNGRINTDINGLWLTTIAEIVSKRGLSTGTVSSVEISHATPACVWAHNISRSNYADIANEMIYASGLDLIMGAGHPEFNNNGNPVTPGTLTYKYVGGKTTWDELGNGTTGQGWTLIQEKYDFEAIAAGTPPIPDRLIGIAQVHQTLQYERNGSTMGNLNENVPTLETMTLAALNLLSENTAGFYLMVEGGAVDWANHDNNIERMIEEQIDFNRSVETVVDWVQKNSSWGETLLIVTSDHETGMLWGPGTYIDVNGNEEWDSGVDIFVDWMHVQNKGKGNIPGVQYASDGHSNTLVPLFAKGRGANRLKWMADGYDLYAKSFWDFNGTYVDNTDVFYAFTTPYISSRLFVSD
jgi:alkaline phosphatase